MRLALETRQAIQCGRTPRASHTVVHPDRMSGEENHLPGGGCRVTHSGQFFERIRGIYSPHSAIASSHPAGFGIAANSTTVSECFRLRSMWAVKRSFYSFCLSPAVAFPSGSYFCPFLRLVLSRYLWRYAHLGQREFLFHETSGREFAFLVCRNGPQRWHIFDGPIRGEGLIRRGDPQGRAMALHQSGVQWGNVRDRFERIGRRGESTVFLRQRDEAAVFASGFENVSGHRGSTPAGANSGGSIARAARLSA
jgi:hypothetical protein